MEFLIVLVSKSISSNADCSGRYCFILFTRVYNLIRPDAITDKQVERKGT